MFSVYRLAYVWIVLSLFVFAAAAVSEDERTPAKTSWRTWAPYRPNLYFGLRLPVPDSLLMGLMWARGDDEDSIRRSLRDTCEQDEGMAGYGWTKYDVRTGGSQLIHDRELHLDLQTDFVKSPDGHAWAVRVSGNPKDDTPGTIKTMIAFHLAQERLNIDQGKKLKCKEAPEALNADQSAYITCEGEYPGLDQLEFWASGRATNKLVGKPVVRQASVPEDQIWKAKSAFVDHITSTRGVNSNDRPGNMQFLQMTFEGPFQVDFIYKPKGLPPVSPDINTVLSASKSQFSERLRNVFPVSTAFEGEAYVKFTASLLSNLLGGLGYFYGDSKVDNSSSPEYAEVDMDFWKGAEQAMSRAKVATTSPTQLLSFTPSRPFFPRGFLWDEGFHLLPVMEWDLDLAVSVIHSWLKLMDDDGWISREQILGPEARSKVPEKFQVQYPHYANPPTLSLLLPVILSKVTKASPYFGHPSEYITPSDNTTDLPSLDKLFPLFDRHYEWFRRTQAGNFSTQYPRPANVAGWEGYRWRGRTPTHTLTSGLDDYPRANPPHPGELHLDALAWVGASAKSLLQLAQHLGLESAVVKYSKHLEEIKRNLDVLHWDAQSAAYCDATVSSSGHYERVCHLGYISLMPFLLGLMEPDHPRLPAVLNLLSDPDKLWSPHGLRSLSLADELYGKDENYWRGAVWMNMNVLAVQQLHALSMADGPEKSRAAKLGAKLRRNVVQTVYDSWATTGFVWEQYSDKTGEGKGSRAFTGWTACIVLLTSLKFADFEAEKGGQGAAATPIKLGVIPTIVLLLAILILILALIILVLAITLHTQQVTEIWDHVNILYRRATGREQVTYEEIIDMDDWNHRSHID
ncbi:glucosidase I [Apiospora saccharicola]|uniref:Mannosyl-oligosaccharide glucosidase n=1 Tax=Apiospora saccharicola TaxID=335842 RepID=A0ABR1UN57_9PEZI